MAPPPRPRLIASTGGSELLLAPPTPFSRQTRQRRPDPPAGACSNQIGETNDSESTDSTNKSTDTSETDADDDSDDGKFFFMSTY